MLAFLFAAFTATTATAAIFPDSPPRPAIFQLGAHSAIFQLGAALASAELEAIQWSSPLARGMLLLLSTILSPLLRRAVALVGSPLVFPGHLDSGSFAAGMWSSSNLTIHGLETLGPLSVSPDGDRHLNATARFGRLQTAMTLDAQTLGMAARLRAEASVANVTIHLRWACSPLRRTILFVKAAQRGGTELAEALNLTINTVEVSIEGPLELQAHESARGIGAPAVMWRWFNSVFARELKRTAEARVAEAMYETLSSVASEIRGAAAAHELSEACKT
eukprot:CAMPEP_0183344484 /NCGR_PEP_ID=MMETSP0164_2-20130417/10151_1 /TAXON_ID=221442 /ORGANISM="Coccolithus pelagicus ssp braarudi, Strain PLY182g" /LENGTH=276 /DNA_ID=CAMNT_0025515485 /DNA_START=15 /DNA_END=845 /DNA_ORIENTATION=-